MATELPTTNGTSAQDGENNFAVKAGLARMLKGGVIMDVVNAEQVSFSHNLVRTPRSDKRRLASQRRPALSPSWPSSVSQQTSARRVAWPA
jgi:hypothetical protein